jgi:hypothetical protein
MDKAVCEEKYEVAMPFWAKWVVHVDWWLAALLFEVRLTLENRQGLSGAQVSAMELDGASPG